MKVYVSVRCTFADIHALTRQPWGAGMVYRAEQKMPEPFEQSTRIFLSRERKNGFEVETWKHLDPGVFDIRSTVKICEKVRICTQLLGAPEGGARSFPQFSEFIVPAETGWYEI